MIREGFTAEVAIEFSLKDEQRRAGKVLHVDIGKECVAYGLN